MIKHTPGPWLQSHRQTNAEAWNTQVYDESGRTIATLDWYPVNLSGGIVGSAREANARLIAAAPDLLQVLKDYRDALMMGPIEIAAKFGPDFNPDDILIEADRKAAAAIAKAEGLYEVEEQGFSRLREKTQSTPPKVRTP